MHSERGSSRFLTCMLRRDGSDHGVVVRAVLSTVALRQNPVHSMSSTGMSRDASVRFSRTR